ncbi:MAG: hypothetical protein ACKPKO_12870 [Candidatus Fonsibacter sp.]
MQGETNTPELQVLTGGKSDDHGGSDAGDKKKQKRKNGRAKEWSKQYRKDNPVKPEKFPRVEFWNDTQWEAYKEDAQREIRMEMNKNGKDLKNSLECKLDLDYGNKDWMYTALLFPSDSVPFDIKDPIEKNMMQKAGGKTLFHQAPQQLDLWGPKSQYKE